ncbi:MAG TPA: hypothetical protein VJ464_21075 [Blastocatellia bacterium]|nr:hypothetical protein [Blastocatellia bacterium]
MSEDPTKPQADEKFDTTPGVTAILERINQVRNEMQQNDSQIIMQLQALQTQVRMMDHKFDILTKELFETKAQVRDTQARVEELERKAS